MSEERILGAAWKLVLGVNSLPTKGQVDIDAAFPLAWPNWDYNSAESKERLWIYCEILMGTL